MGRDWRIGKRSEEQDNHSVLTIVNRNLGREEPLQLICCVAMEVKFSCGSFMQTLTERYVRRIKKLLLRGHSINFLPF